MPKIDYSISADYGRVTIINTNESRRVDLLGTPMDMCSKIIHEASLNEFIIGENLYEVVKNYDDYCFKEVKNYSNKLEYDNRVYTVTRNKKVENGKNV